MALTDYEGKQYDPATLFALTQQILPRLDPNMMGGSAWGEAGQSIGFDFNAANQLFQQQFGRPMTIADQIALDMARNLASRGVTDLSQLKAEDRFDQVPIEPIVPNGGPEFGYRAGNHVLTPEEVQKYVVEGKPNAEGQYFMPSATASGKQVSGLAPLSDGFAPANFGGAPGATYLGGTYTGEGGTQYNAHVGPDGQIQFGTFGSSSSDFDKGDLMGVLSVLGIAGAGQLGMLGNGTAAGEMLAPELSSASAFPEFSSWTGASSFGAGAGAGAELLSPELSSLSSYPEFSSWTGPSSFGSALPPELLSPEAASPSSYQTSPGLPTDIPGVPPNPFANSPSSMLPPGIKDLLGPAATVAGALAGGQGQQGSASQTQDLPDFLKGPVANDLIPRTQGLLSSQLPVAQQAGQSMMNAGQGLLSQTPGSAYTAVARIDPGNQFGKIALDRPDTPTNPYLSARADDITRRTKELLDQNNLSIQGNAVATGGLGGSRMGVAQGLAASKAGDYLSGNLANLYGQAYDADMNRALSKYGVDTSFATAQRGQDLTRTSLDMNFFDTQRGKELASLGVGQGLLSSGLDAQWAPLKNTAGIYANFSPYGTKTTNTDQGGGWQGLLGGALSGAALAGKLGFWGK